jgi:hypothetical protein
MAGIPGEASGCNDARDPPAFDFRLPLLAPASKLFSSL